MKDAILADNARSVSSVDQVMAPSGNDSYALKATLTWEISWTGAGGTAGDLPNGTFATTTDVQVQEIQSVNR